MIQSVQRASTILKLFKDHTRLSIAEIAEMSGLHKTTAFTIVDTLREEKILEKDPRTKEYYLGIEFFELSTKYRGRNNLRSIALPYLGEFARKTKETVQLTILDGSDAVYLFKITHPSYMSFAVAEGTRVPANCPASGKAILSYLPWKKVEGMFVNGLRLMTEYSIRDLEDLQKQLEISRERGFSEDFRETDIGLGGLGVAVFDQQGDVTGSISISFPYENMQYMRMEFLPVLKRTAFNISTKLGCPFDKLPYPVISEMAR